MKGSVPYMAPEVFTEHAVPRTDVWALGVVTFELLAGKRPYKAENPMAMYASLKSKPPDMSPLQELGLDAQLRAFIERTLTKAIGDRPTARQCLDDAWLGSRQRKTIGVSRREGRKLERSIDMYINASHFTKAAMNCIAAQLSSSEVERCTQLFQSFDIDRSGKLSGSELQAGLLQLGVNEDAIAHIADTLDVNSNGLIDYTEFVACLLQTQGQLIENVMLHAFNVFDTNASGTITLDELGTMMGGDGPLSSVVPEGTSIVDTFKEIDLSNDGVITFSEFKRFLSAATRGNGKGANTSAVDPSESLESILRRISTKLGRPEEECANIARLLSEKHWLRTVGDLCNLRDAEWARLGLPVKLESMLHAYVDTAAPAAAREAAAEATTVTQSLRLQAQSPPRRLSTGTSLTRPSTSAGVRSPPTGL